MYYWRDFTGKIPYDAIGCHNIYVARVLRNGQLPASLIGNRAITECCGKKEVLAKGIEVLCDLNKTNFVWEHVNINSLTGSKLKDLVLGGFEDGSELYIGKVFHEGKWKIGKVFPATSRYKGFRGWNDSDGSCYVTDDFQILRYPSICPKPFLQDQQST